LQLAQLGRFPAVAFGEAFDHLLLGAG